MARAASPAAFTENERNVLLLTGVAHAATHYAELMYPTLAVVLARESDIPLERVLTWSFAGYLMFGLGALPAGYLADRIGARRLLVGALATMGLSIIAAGFSAPGIPLATCLTVLGFAGSIYHPAGMGLISRTVAARGRALGINGIFGSVGIAATAAVTAALAARLGWRGALWVSGGALLASSLWFARIPIREAGADPETAPPGGVESPLPATRIAFLLLCTSAMLAGITYRGNTLAQPPYFAERVTVMGYGVATSLAFLLGVAGQYAGGLVADRHDLRHAYFAFHLLSLPALVLMTTLVELPLIAAAGVFTLFSLGMQPIENSLFAALTPPRWRSTGYGIKFVLTFGVGSVGVWLVSWIDGMFGLAMVYAALAGIVVLLLMVIAIFAFAPGLRGDERTHPPAAIQA